MPVVEREIGWSPSGCERADLQAVDIAADAKRYIQRKKACRGRLGRAAVSALAAARGNAQTEQRKNHRAENSSLGVAFATQGPHLYTYPELVAKTSEDMPPETEYHSGCQITLAE